MIFKRDYSYLTEKEQKEFDLAKKFVRSKKEDALSVHEFYKYHEMMPAAGYHFESLFPNNYLLFNYQKHEDCSSLLRDFSLIIRDDKSTERDILNFIRDNEAYFILEALFKYYDFGHHDSYLFREFPLPPQYICDFLLVGKNSGGFEFVFIEFEHPNKDTTRKNGELGESYRKGLKQIEDWELWIESNFNSLRNVFNIYKNKEHDLPSEFYELDKSRIHFLVVAGKREHFNEKTYRLKRKSRKSVRIIHYDNIIDCCYDYIKNQKNAAQ